MPTIEQIKNEIEDTEVIRTISSALLEVAALRIKNIKREFEHNQSFFKEVSDLYNIIKTSAQRLGISPHKNDTQYKEMLTMSIAVTSNQRFHGLLNSRVVDRFLDSVDSKKSDCIIVGRTGKQYASGGEEPAECEYVTFKNDYPTPNETRAFLQKIAPYSQVFLYYPKFVTVFSQEVGVIDITYSPDPTTDGVDREKEPDYIYEPELIKIIDFFETQVRRLLFLRIMLESELARTSARLVKMNTTESRATEMVEEKKRELRKEQSIVNDIHLLESFSGINQWLK